MSGMISFSGMKIVQAGRLYGILDPLKLTGKLWDG